MVTLSYGSVQARPQQRSSIAAFIIGTGASAPTGTTLIDLDTPYVLHSAADLDLVGGASRSVGASGTLRRALAALFESVPAPVVAIRILSNLSKAAPVLPTATVASVSAGGAIETFTISAGGSGLPQTGMSASPPSDGARSGASLTPIVNAAGVLTGIDIGASGTGYAVGDVISFAGVATTVGNSPFARKVISQIQRWSNMDSEQVGGHGVGVQPYFAVDSGFVEDSIDEIGTAIAEAYATEAVQAKGIAIFGGGSDVDTTAEYATWYDAHAHAQTGRVLPLLIASVTDAGGAHAAAPAVAGAILRSVRDNGAVENPELQPVHGISSFLPAFSYNSSGTSPADAAAHPSSSRNATILVRHRGGILTYGMELATTSGSDPLRYVSTRMVADIVDAQLTRISEGYRGKRASLRNIGKLEEELQEELATLRGQGLIRPGTQIAADAAHNTASNIAAGRVRYSGTLRLYGVIRTIGLMLDATLQPA